jgi:hypothetical protein
MQRKTNSSSPPPLLTKIYIKQTFTFTELPYNKMRVTRDNQDSNIMIVPKSILRPTYDSPPSNSTEAKNRVTISRYSTVKLYVKDESDQASEIYSASDFRCFRKEMCRCASHIQRTISSLHLPTGVAFKTLMERDLLHSEDLLGIEHLIKSEKSSIHHTNFVLEAQQELRKSKYDKVEKVEILARLAGASSAINVKNSTLKAKLAEARDDVVFVSWVVFKNRLNSVSLNFRE